MDGAATPLSLLAVVAALAGYLLGSIPFGLLLTRAFGAGDLRTIGSGNIGATNVLRTGRKGLAAATLVLDGGKGAVACLALSQWGAEPGLIAAIATVLGHNFPLWLGFRGGKGVATTLGVLLALAWPVGMITCGIWLAVAAASRYSSLAALVALGLAPVVMLVFADGTRAAAALFLALLAVARHHANIRRLVRGEEPKIVLSGKDRS